MMPSRGMGNIAPSKRPKKITRKDDPNEVDRYADGGSIKADKPSLWQQTKDSWDKDTDPEYVARGMQADKQAADAKANRDEEDAEIAAKRAKMAKGGVIRRKTKR